LIAERAPRPSDVTRTSRGLIPEQTTIAQLHHVMQLAMGWHDEHLHRFVIRGWRYGGHRDGALQFFDGPDPLSLAAFG
jgi:hypothetical protein